MNVRGRRKIYILRFRSSRNFKRVVRYRLNPFAFFLFCDFFFISLLILYLREWGFLGGFLKNIFIWVFFGVLFCFFVFYFKFKYQYKKNEWQNWTILFDNKFNLKILSNQTNSRYLYMYFLTDKKIGSADDCTNETKIILFIFLP